MWLRQGYGAGLIQDGAHESLKSTGRVGGLVIYDGVILKVELESGGLHSVLIERLRRKCTESKPIQREKRGTRNSDWSLVV